MNVSAFDAPPVGAGFVTVTLNAPVAVSDVLGIVTVTITGVMAVGVSVVEPNVTVAPDTKLEPLIVID